MQLRIIGIGLSFLIVFIAGIRLTRSGKPYSGLLLNVHKLISLAGVVLLALVIRQASRDGTLSPTELALSAVSGLLLAGTIVTGGLVSIDRPMPQAVLIAHRILPFLSAVASAATLYLLLSSR